MATYFHTPNNQREASPMIYSRESWPGSTNPEPSPAISTNMMMYMNYLSSTNEMPPPQQEFMSRIGDENDFSPWVNNRSEMPFLPPMGSATSLLQGVQNMQSQSQGLNLSLSTQIPSTIQIPTNYSPSNTLRDEESSPNKQMRSGEYGIYSGYMTENAANYGEPSGGRTVPNSKYLKAAQQLLDEVVNVRNALKKQDSKSGDRVEGESRSENKFPLASEATSNPQNIMSSSTNELSAGEKQDLQNKLSKLLTMLDEVERRYKQYYHQMQIVVSSFDVVAGHGSAKPYTALALQTISRHFRCLRDAIADQIRAVRNSLGENDISDNGGKGNVGISRLRYVDQHLKQQRALQQLGMMQQHAWRPQRGLPESSVSILRAWLFEHFLHPYPKDSEKLMLARQTGLTRSQVSNWFINARVRLWKPMVEEMYKEEAGEAETDSLSSPEIGDRAAKKDINAPDDSNNQDLQQHTNSAAQSENARFPESKHGLISDMETTRATYHGLLSEMNQRVELRPCLDNNVVFEGYQIPEFGRFANPNGVSLTLGLQHREAGTQSVSVDNQNFNIYNDESSFT